MLIELVIEQWLKAGLAMYKANPILLESIFFDGSQAGMPTLLADGLATDETQRWIPGMFAEGLYRWGRSEFPITGNVRTELALIGDPSLVDDLDGIGYRIVPAATRALKTYFAEHTIPVVQTAFGQLPTELPALTISLEQDAQGPSYLGELVSEYVIDGVEYKTNRTDVMGRYCISCYAVNRLETLWLYAFVTNLFVGAQQQLAAFGLYDVGMNGMDVHPLIQFLPERAHVRHFILSATRPERAVNLLSLEALTGFTIEIDAQYAQLRFTVPLP